MVCTQPAGSAADWKMRERKGKRKKERLTYRRQIKGWNPARVHEGDKRESVHMPADTGKKRMSAIAHGRLPTSENTRAYR